MTGFARATAQAGDALIAWEIKSVNGKGAEVRFRLPPGFERIEPPARQGVLKRFARGSFQAALAVARPASQAQPVVNEAFLMDLAGLARRLEEQFGCAPATADGLLGIRGVLDVPETVETDEERAALDAAVLAALEVAMDGLEAARRQEGAALGELLGVLLDEIEALTERAEIDPSRDPQVIRQRLGEQVRLLLDASSAALDEGRIAVEAAFLATKADIREEVDRLKTHVASGRNLLTSEGPVGRKLDFLAQEFNRESNTLCSKSNATSVTAVGLELKAVVDQFREQVQNLE